MKKDDPSMRDSFELVVTFIAPSDPVAKKRVAGQRPIAEISSAFTDGINKKLGTSGVELCWYKRKEFVALNDAQKEELNRIQGTGAYLRPSKNKPPCELAISRDIAN